MFLSKIILHDESSNPILKIERQKEFLEKNIGVKTEIRNGIPNCHRDNDVKRISACRIFDIKKPFVRHNPTEEEIKYEKHYMSQSFKNENIVMYDGFELQSVFTSFISQEEAYSEVFHIIFTDRLTCTYDYNDYRYHGRAVIASNPAIISTIGIVEAPAKPREYYYDLITKTLTGLNVDSLKERYKGQYLEYNDPAFPIVIEGYILQAIFYYLTGEAFCENKDCRLYNAHWQKDLIHSQIIVGKLCNKHQKILQEIRNTYK